MCFLLKNNNKALKERAAWWIIVVFLFVTGPSNAFESVALPDLPSVPSEPVVVSKGDVYYVNQDIGSDRYTIDQAKNKRTPWATVQRGARALKAGDTLVVAKSIEPYYERVDLNVRGDENAWISIVGLNGKRPVVSGFVLHEKTRYIKLRNFILQPKRVGVYLKRGSGNFFIEDIEINGNGVANYGIKFGADIVDNRGVKNGYVKNTEIHHTVGYGVYIENGAENIVFDKVVSHHSLKNDGFAGRSNPSEKTSPTKNLYFINSEAHHNARDGFDIGSGVNQVFINCMSYGNGVKNQGAGFKVWGGVEDGGDVFLINNVAYNNSAPAVDVKNIADVNIYLYHNTFVGNGVKGGGVEIMATDYNNGSGGFSMGVPRFYIFNNFIFSTGSRSILSLYNADSIIVKSDCNYVISLNDVPYCNVRDINMKVTDTIRVSQKGKKYAGSGRCNWSENKSRIHVVKNKRNLGLVDLDNNNYMLTENSPLIGMGCNIGVDFDINNVPRDIKSPDIGAYEHVTVVN